MSDCTTPRFIGGCKDGDDASKHERAHVDVMVFAGFHVALRQERYDRDDDGNYRFVKSTWIRNIADQVAANA